MNLFFKRVGKFVSAILLLSISVKSQDLALRLGDRIKTFRANTYINVLLSPIHSQPNDKCDSRFATGQLIGHNADTVFMRIVSMQSATTFENSGLLVQKTTYHTAAKTPVMPIAKSSILSITKAGKKRVRETTALQVTGSVLIVLGAGHLTAAPFLVEDKLDMGLVGLSEILLGAVLFGIGERNIFTTSEFCPNTRPGTPVWQIQ